MGESMNKRDVFEHLMRKDPVFRKKVASRAGAIGMSLFAAAKGCTAEVEQEQVGEMISQDKAKVLNGGDAKLTPKEQDVQKAMLKLKDIDKVGRQLKMKEESVRYHIRHIFHKTGNDLMILTGKKLRNNHVPQQAQDGAVRSKANGSSRYHPPHGGDRGESIKRNAKLRQAILTALAEGPGTAADIRQRMPKAAREKLILSKSMMGNAMTALKGEKSIRRKGKSEGNKTLWQLS
jgi:DNA-binding CsgD family transcriptional regulator